MVRLGVVGFEAQGSLIGGTCGTEIVLLLPQETNIIVGLGEVWPQAEGSGIGHPGGIEGRPGL